MNPQNSQQRPQSKNQRRNEAREQARQIREAAAKKQRRSKWLIRGGIVVAVLAIVALVVTVTIINIKNSAPIADNGPRPANTNQYNGVTIAANNQVVTIPAGEDVDMTSLPEMPTPRPTSLESPQNVGIGPSAPGEPVQVVIYADFSCEFCKAFGAANETVLADMASAGQITYEYRPIGFLDNPGSQNYSSRAAAAASCIASEQPENYLGFLKQLYDNQPTEGMGLSNDQIKQYAQAAGASVDGCIDDRTYRPFVKYATAQAQLDGITATPSIFVDGQQYQTTQQANFNDFRSFVEGVIEAKQS